MSDLKLTVLYGTETGNCEGIAQKVAKKGEKNGVAVDLVNLSDYTVEQFAAIDHPVLFVISTWDDGAPPPKCSKFCNELFSAETSLKGMPFAVLALGDKDYPLFCECGKLVDAKLAELGAERVLDRTDMGADFMVDYIGWSKRFWKTMKGVYGVGAA